MYVVNTVFYVINVALPLTRCIGYNFAIKYSSSSSLHKTWLLARNVMITSVTTLRFLMK